MNRISQVIAFTRERFTRYRGSIVLVGTPTLLMIGLFFYLSPHQRAVTIEARTLSISIEFTGIQNDWKLRDEVIFCKRRQGKPREIRQLIRAELEKFGETSNACGDGPYVPHKQVNATIRWPKGTRVRLEQASGIYPATIHIQGMAGTEQKQPDPTVGQDISQGSFYKLSRESVSNSGIARFTGKVRVGDIPTTGSSLHLLSGKYEIWDVPTLSRSANQSKSGQLLLGDSARVVKNSHCESDCTVEGKVIIALDLGEQGMQILLHAGEADDLLLIERFGGNKAYLGSSWLDRARNDSVFVALSAILALIAALSAAGSGVFSVVRIYSRRNRQSGLNE